MKKKGLLLASISMVLVAVLALTTASFAWFTASMNPSVESFDVNVTTGKSLLVSAKETEGFKTIVTKADLVAVTTNNLIQNATAKLNAASPKTLVKTTNIITLNGGAIDFVKPKPLSLETDIWTEDATHGYDDITTNVDGADKECFYVKFDLYFKSSAPGAAADVKVSLDLGKTNASDVNGTDYDGTDFYGIDATTKARLNPLKSFQGQIAKVLRVAFVPDVTTKTGTPEAPNAERILNAPDAIVYEPNSTTGLALSAEADATNKVKPVAPVIDEKHMVASTVSKIIPETGIIPAQTAHDLFTLKAGKTAKMTVYIWIEGNDPDCVNEVSGAFFRSNIKFFGV